MQRVKTKQFIITSPIVAALFLLGCDNGDHYIALGVMYIATLLNLFFLVQIVDFILTNRKEVSTSWDKWKLALFFMGKMAVITLALIYSVQIMGNKLIIPILSYISQIFVLGFALKR